jgi:predicted nucleic acid-binding protein
MGKIKRAVFDAGPFIHLHEISKLNLNILFEKIFTTAEILKECKKIETLIKKLKNFEMKKLAAESKDLAKYLINRYNLDLGESTGIALCKQENIKLFFTDDLEAREVSKKLGFEPHGTLAILLRSFREKILTKEEVKKSVEKLYTMSTLFLTKDLKDWILNEIEKV